MISLLSDSTLHLYKTSRCICSIQKVWREQQQYTAVCKKCTVGPQSGRANALPALPSVPALPSSYNVGICESWSSLSP